MLLCLNNKLFLYFSKAVMFVRGREIGDLLFVLASTEFGGVRRRASDFSYLLNPFAASFFPSIENCKKRYAGKHT